MKPYGIDYHYSHNDSPEVANTKQRIRRSSKRRTRRKVKEFIEEELAQLIESAQNESESMAYLGPPPELHLDGNGDTRKEHDEVRTCLGELG